MITLDDGDHALPAALSRDGRKPCAELAAATGWSESTVKRRVDHLRRSDVLAFDIDLPPAVPGYRSEARLWLAVRPSALLPVADALACHPEIAFAAIYRDSRDLYRHLTERISSLDDARTLETAPLVRTVKRAGAVLPG